MSVIGFDELHQTLTAADRSNGIKRILLVGSSPVHIGLSARLIQAGTGIPTFNLGTDTAGAYFQDYMDQITPHVRKGDIVVVSDPTWMSPAANRLKSGCISKLEIECSYFHSSTFPHLLDMAIYTFNWPAGLFKGSRQRDGRGDADGLDLIEGKSVIRRLRPSANIDNAALQEMVELVHEIQTKDACPLLVFGPVLINNSERNIWLTQISSLYDAISKRGLDKNILKYGIISTDRTDFLDSYEHPSPKRARDWTQSIVDRLNYQKSSLCSAVMTEN